MRKVVIGVGSIILVVVIALGLIGLMTHNESSSRLSSSEKTNKKVSSSKSELKKSSSLDKKSASTSTATDSSVAVTSSSENVASSAATDNANSQIGEYRDVTNGSESGDKVVNDETVTAQEIADGRQQLAGVDQNASNAMSNGDIAKMILQARQSGQTLVEYFNAHKN
ncbi:MAG: hypothetical protein ACLUQY_05795 [Weissella confusa]|uniref:hypothetical protein n=1 Tax=Weissella confusa TaxID=1583 RepID=UPI0013DFCB40|nr:hypothetical protein [Weissella confusa]MBJ7670868.1 hypothetical protein [Weissella confusa]QIE79068.1 hypothetical protein G4V46_07455 [Weissella confusa]